MSYTHALATMLWLLCTRQLADPALCSHAGCPQYLFKKLIYYPYIQDPITQFIDLLYLANISVFFLENGESSGWYIHGRNQATFSDATLRCAGRACSSAHVVLVAGKAIWRGACFWVELRACLGKPVTLSMHACAGHLLLLRRDLNAELLKEEEGLKAARGLVAASTTSKKLADNQLFRVYLKEEQRKAYDQKLLTQVAQVCAATACGRGHAPCNARCMHAAGIQPLAGRMNEWGARLTCRMGPALGVMLSS